MKSNSASWHVTLGRVVVALLLMTLTVGALFAAILRATAVPRFVKSHARASAAKPAPAHSAARVRTVAFGRVRPRARVNDTSSGIPQYTLQDLGTWPTGTISPLGLNDAGDVPGDGQGNPSYYTNGYVWTSGGGAQDIGTLYSSANGSYSYAGYFGTENEFPNLGGFEGGGSASSIPNLSAAINASAQITGASQINTQYGTHAILWSAASGLIDLGALPSYAAGNSYGVAINSGGQVVGGADFNTTTSPINHAFVWTPGSANGTTGTMTDLGVIADSGNDTGPPNFGGGARPAVARPLTSSGPDPISLGSFAYGINDGGEVVGYADAGNGYTHAFLDSGSAMYDLGTLNGTGAHSEALGINGYGEVFGLSDVNTLASGYDNGSEGGHAFQWVPNSQNGTDGVMLDLGTLSTDYDYGSTPTAMNGGGFVVGQASVNGINPASQVPVGGDPNGPFGQTYVPYGHAFLYDDVQMNDLGALYCGTGGSAEPYNVSNYTYYSWASGINDAGTVVGSSNLDGLLYAPINGGAPTHAFVSMNGFTYDLNDLLTGSNVSGWTLSNAYSVNNSGQIAGVGTGPDGSLHAFLLTPTTPSTTVPTPTVTADGANGANVYSSSLFPQNNLAGNPDFTLAINGSNFTPDAQVTFNGAVLSSITVESDSLILATVPASEIATPGNYPVVVTNPGNGVSSATMTFTVLPDVQTPTLTSLNPNSAVAGGPNFEMTIQGTNFDSTTRVNFNGDQLTPDSVSSDGTSLTVAIPASDYQSPPNANGAGYYYVPGSTIAVTVTNYPNSTDIYAANHYGITSNSLPFTVSNPAPTITSITPPQVAVGASGVYISINGTGFNASTQVTWKNPNDGTGSTQPTFYWGSGTLISIYLKPNDTTNAAVVPITVTNPPVLSSGNDGGSATANFTIGLTITKITLNPTSVVGGQPSSGTVTLSGPAPAAGLNFSIMSDNAAAVPANGTVTAGQTTGSFSIATTAVAQTTTANLTAANSTASAALTITPPTVASVTLNPTSVAGGQPSSGTVTLSGPAPTGGVTVTVTSDNAAATPSNATVGVGQTTGSFSVTTTAVNQQATANIKASYNNSSASAALTITPPNPTVISVILSPPSVVGGKPAMGNVTLSGPAPAGGATVSVTSDNASASPTGVTVTAGQTMGMFSVTTSAVTLTTTANIKASYNSSSASRALTITSSDANSPQILLAATAGSGVVNLAWTPVPGASYNLYRGLEPDGESATPYASALTGLTYADTNVVNGTTYYYFVRPVSGGTAGAASNQAFATPLNAAMPTPLSDLQIAISTESSWVGHASQFTATLTNTGGAPQYLSEAQVTPQTTVGTGWVARDSTLSTKPLLPGKSVQVTFDLTVPSSAVGGTASSPTVVPLTLVVTGNAVYQRDFNLNLYQNPPTSLKVSVVDNNNNPLPGALIAFDNDPKLYGTDGNGQVTLPETPGSPTVYAYAKGFLPNQQNTHLVTGQTTSVTIALQPGDPLATTSFTVTPLTADQAAADGVSLDDPDNYSVYQFTLNIGVRVEKGIGAFRNTTAPGEAFGGEGAIIDYQNNAVIAQAIQAGPNQFIIVWLAIPGEIHFLKQFFDAAALVTNDTPYTIADVSASIDVPDGLELPQLNGEDQPEEQQIGDLKPYQTGKAEWVVRGDDPGDYTIGGSTEGSLKLGGASVPVDGELDGDVTVEEPELDLNFTTPGNVTAGTPFTLGIDITNQSAIDLDYATIDLTAADMVNCYLPSSQPEEQDLGTIPAGGTVHVNYQIIPEVTGPVVQVQHYITNDPDTMPEVKVRSFLLEAANESVTTPAGTPLTIDALKDAIAVAIGEDLGTLKYVGVSAAGNGVSAIDTQSTPTVLAYTPNSGFVGPDSFGYAIADSKGDTSTATVMVSVTQPQLGSLSLSPASAPVQSGATPLTITGSGFFPGSTVSFNGVPLTGFVVSSPTKITAVIPAPLLQSAGPASVQVSNGSNSAFASFTISGNPAPFETNVSPNTAPAGSSGQTVTVTGLGFVAGSTVQWNGTALPTTFLNAGTLTAQIPASDLAKSIGASVTVASPSPGGGTSAALPFTVASSAPVLKTTLASLTRGSGGLTAAFSIANAGSAPATNLHVVSAKLLYASGGKVVTLSAASLTQPSPSTLTAGGSVPASVLFTGALPATGSNVIVQVTLVCDQITSSGASIAAKAP